MQHFFFLFIIPLNKFSCFFIIKNKFQFYPSKKYIFLFFNQCARAFHSNPQYKSFIHDKECWMESTGGMKKKFSHLITFNPLQFFLYVSAFFTLFLCALFLFFVFGLLQPFCVLFLLLRSFFYTSHVLHFCQLREFLLFLFIWIFISVLLENICELKRGA